MWVNIWCKGCSLLACLFGWNRMQLATIRAPGIQSRIKDRPPPPPPLSLRKSRPPKRLPPPRRLLQEQKQLRSAGRASYLGLALPSPQFALQGQTAEWPPLLNGASTSRSPTSGLADHPPAMRMKAIRGASTGSQHVRTGKCTRLDDAGHKEQTSASSAPAAAAKAAAALRKAGQPPGQLLVRLLQRQEPADWSHIEPPGAMHQASWSYSTRYTVMRCSAI